MTFRTDDEFDEDQIHESQAAAPTLGAVAAAAVVSVLVIATTTLTIVASGLDLSSALPFG
jgi:hypothetical protein